MDGLKSIRASWVVLTGVTVFVVIAWGSVEYCNVAWSTGDVPLLESYHREYSGGGSLKWRGEGNRFHFILLTRGLPAYPAAVSVAIMSIVLFVSAGSRSDRAVAVCTCLLVTAILFRLVLLGVAGAALEVKF